MGILSGLAGGGAGNAAYVTARVASRRSTLLPRDTYEKMLHMELPQIGRFIGETTYGGEIEELGQRLKGIDLVELATYLHLAHQCRGILAMCQGSLRTQLALYLRRWDVWNVKTVLRGKSHNETVEHILEEIVAAGELPFEFFQTVAQAPNLDEALSLLESTPYGPAIQRGFREGATLNLRLVEDQLDREYYLSLNEALVAKGGAAARLRTFIRSEVDAVNLKSLFRLKYDSVPVDVVSQAVIPFGDLLEEATLRRLIAAEPFGAFVQEVASLDGLSTEVKAAAERVEADKSLNRVLTALEHDFLRRADTLASGHPLSILPVIVFILRKKIEVDNIRIVARGIQRGLPMETIRQMLVV